MEGKVGQGGYNRDTEQEIEVKQFSANAFQWKPIGAVSKLCDTKTISGTCTIFLSYDHIFTRTFIYIRYKSNFIRYPYDRGATFTESENKVWEDTVGSIDKEISH